MKTGDEIQLWTVQKEAAWDHAQQTGILKADGRRVPQYFRLPYRWLIGQMCQRVASYKGGYPVWAYPEQKPDLRQSQFSPGVKGVRIGFVAEPVDILISDFDAWHAVLGGHYLSTDEEDEVTFNAGREFFSVWRDGESDPEHASKIVESWERIFDLELLRSAPGWYGAGELQATLGAVTLEQVTDVTPFISR